MAMESFLEVLPLPLVLVLPLFAVFLVEPGPLLPRLPLLLWVFLPGGILGALAAATALLLPLLEVETTGPDTEVADPELPW